MNQILIKETYGRKEIENKSYAEVLANGTGAIERVDQFNTEGMRIAADMKNIADNRI